MGLINKDCYSLVSGLHGSKRYSGAEDMIIVADNDGTEFHRVYHELMRADVMS